MSPLQASYPWTTSPLIVSAPMRLISLPRLSVAVSRAGGIGFLAAGYEFTHLAAHLQQAADLLSDFPHPSPRTLPIGVGFILHSASLPLALSALRAHPPACVWLFAPAQPADLHTWSTAIREATHGATRVWIQIGSVAEALDAVRKCRPDVLVVQGADAGGHGLLQSASIVTLLPEVTDALQAAGFGDVLLVAAGGIMDGRGAAAALALGAAGVAMGTRFLASREAEVAPGYVDAVLAAQDGGMNTVRTRVYDMLRGLGDWPEGYGARGVKNRSWEEWEAGVEEKELKSLYQEALGKGREGWGKEGRLTTYAGSGVGLVRGVKGAGEIVESVRGETLAVLRRVGKL